MKKTKTKKVKGGFVAFLAACLLTVNVAPAMAGGEWDLLWPLIFELCKELSGESNGSDKILCWSRAKNDNSEFYVDCSTCTRQVGKAKGLANKCTPHNE